MNYTAGIDVGKKGCFCLLSEDMKTIEFYDFPSDEHNVSEYFKNLNKLYDLNNITFTFIERVHAMPNQGTVSMFNFGVNYGMWKMFLHTIGSAYDFTTPQKWMKAYNIAKEDGKTTKDQVKTVVKRLFPNAIIEGSRGGYKDGRGDALLMAYYATTRGLGSNIIK